MLWAAQIAQPRHAVESELCPSALPTRKHVILAEPRSQLHDLASRSLNELEAVRHQRGIRGSLCALVYALELGSRHTRVQSVIPNTGDLDGVEIQLKA